MAAAAMKLPLKYSCTSAMQKPAYIQHCMYFAQAKQQNWNFEASAPFA